MKFSRQEYWSWVAISSSRRSAQPKDRTWVSCIAGGFFTMSHRRSCSENFNRTHRSRGSWPSPESVVHVAGTPLVTSDAVESFWTQARFAAVAREACFAEAGATHVVTLRSVDTLAGLRAESSVGANGALILAPAAQEGGVRDGSWVSALWE